MSETIIPIALLIISLLFVAALGYSILQFQRIGACNPIADSCLPLIGTNEFCHCWQKLTQCENEKGTGYSGDFVLEECLEKRVASQ